MSIFEYEKNKDSYIQEKLKSRSAREGFKSAYNSLEEFCVIRLEGKTLEQTLEAIIQSKSKENDVWRWLQNFVNYLEGKGLNSVTVRTNFKRIKPYIAYRLEIKIHNEDVKTEIKFPHKIKEKRHGLSTIEIKTILNYATPARKALYFCLLSSGLRIQEACHLRKRDFDTESERWKINLRAKYTKTKSERTTFISKEASEHLKPILNKIKDDDLVFGVSEDPWRSTLTEESYFGRLRKRAGLANRYDSSRFNKITLHSLRSYFITKCEKIHDGFGHALAGHERYMGQYERFSDKELMDFYIDAEPELTIYDSEIKSKAQEELTQKVKNLQEDMDTMFDKIHELEGEKEDNWEENRMELVKDEIRKDSMFD